MIGEVRGLESKVSQIRLSKKQKQGVLGSEGGRQGGRSRNGEKSVFLVTDSQAVKISFLLENKPINSPWDPEVTSSCFTMRHHDTTSDYICEDKMSWAGRRVNMSKGLINN